MSKSLRHENIWIPSVRHAPSVPPTKFQSDLFTGGCLFCYGATKDDIDRLPKYNFKRIDDFEKDNREIQSALSEEVVELLRRKDDVNVYIWPMSKSVQYGNKTLILSKDFNLKTDGSKYKDESGILKDRFTRLLDVVTLNNVVEYNFGKVDQSVLLHGIHVVVLSEGNGLQYGVDESYKLYINSKGNPNYAHIEVGVYGALHALQGKFIEFVLSYGCD
ncbi:putative beta-N-acetylhexosaminidase [Helianthus anomalus]